MMARRQLHARFPQVAVAGVMLTLASTGWSDDAGKKSTIPPITLSPDKRFGVSVPVFKIDADDAVDSKNAVIEMKTGRMLAEIDAEPGYDRALNHREVLPPRWAADSSVLVWEVSGKWFPTALVVLKLEDDSVKWQTNVLTAAQKEMLQRTRDAQPKQYAAAKKANEGNGSAYPEGFTITVEVLDPVALPLKVRAALTSNPKGIESHVDLDSYLLGMIDSTGALKVTSFKLGKPPWEPF